MTPELLAALAAAAVVVGPVVVSVITALRTRQDVLEVKRLVNGHSTRMDERLAEVTAALVDETGRRR